MRNPLRAASLGSIDADDMIQIQNDFVLGFLDKHLLNKSNDFPQAAYRKHKQWVEKNDISDIRTWWLESHPEDAIERVVIETNAGDIELALYPKRAPIAVNNFLADVDTGFYNNASFYQATDSTNRKPVGLIRADMLANTMARQAISRPKFLFNIQDKPLSGASELGVEDEDFVIFHRVLRGVNLLKKIQSQVYETKALMEGKKIHSPIVIKNIYRVHAQ